MLDEMGWYWGNSGGRTHSVTLKQPNAFGLYDMHGNVWEWVQDWIGPYTSEAKTDPTGGFFTSRGRVKRGGSWRHSASDARSASRPLITLANGLDEDGLRLARTP